MGTITRSVLQQRRPADRQLRQLHDLRHLRSRPTGPTARAAARRTGRYNVHTGYTYDAAGNQATVTAPNGRVTTSIYDAQNRLVQTIDNDVASPTLPSEDIVTTYAYDDLGRQAAVIRENADGNEHRRHPHGVQPRRDASRRRSRTASTAPWVRPKGAPAPAPRTQPPTSSPPTPTTPGASWSRWRRPIRQPRRVARRQRSRPSTPTTRGPPVPRRREHDRRHKPRRPWPTRARRRPRTPPRPRPTCRPATPTTARATSRR